MTQNQIKNNRRDKTRNLDSQDLARAEHPLPLPHYPAVVVDSQVVLRLEQVAWDRRMPMQWDSLPHQALGRTSIPILTPMLGMHLGSGKLWLTRSAVKLRRPKMTWARFRIHFRIRLLFRKSIRRLRAMMG